MGGAEYNGGVRVPKVGSREEASGEKLNLSLRGGGTLGRVNLGRSVSSGDDGEVVVGAGAEAIATPGAAADSVTGELTCQWEESGVKGPVVVVVVVPKSNWKPVSMKGIGLGGSAGEMAVVDAVVGGTRIGRLGLDLRGVVEREGGELLAVWKLRMLLLSVGLVRVAGTGVGTRARGELSWLLATPYSSRPGRLGL